MKCYSSKTSLFYTLFTQNRTLVGETNETDTMIHGWRHDLLYATAREGIWASHIADRWPRKKRHRMHFGLDTWNKPRKKSGRTAS